MRLDGIIILMVGKLQKGGDNMIRGKPYLQYDPKKKKFMIFDPKGKVITKFDFSEKNREEFSSPDVIDQLVWLTEKPLPPRRV